MEALAYAHSYEAYEREAGIEVNLSERLWNWRGVPSAFGLHLLAIAALVFFVCLPDVARANVESPARTEEVTTPLSARTSSEEPPRAAELREELRQLSQQKTDFYNEGTNAAAAAAELAKTAESHAEWQNVVKFWQQAIAAMESVPEGDRDYALARGKISEYQSNLETARSQPAKSKPDAPSLAPETPAQPLESSPQAPSPLATETVESTPLPSELTGGEIAEVAPQQPDFFDEGKNAAAAAIELGKTAQTESEWQNVAKIWQQAIAAMESVPEGDRNYALARGKISEYQANLDKARSQPKKSPEAAKSSQPAPEKSPEAAKSSQPAPEKSPAPAPEKSPEAAKSSQPAPEKSPAPAPEISPEPAKSSQPAPSLAPLESAPQQSDFFYEGTNAAAAAAELGKIAETQQEWQNVAKFWQQAIAAMESVPEGDRDYALARGKISEYQSNLETARSQPEKSPEPAKSKPQSPPPTPVQSSDRAPEKSPEPVKSSQLAPSPQPRAAPLESAPQQPDFFYEGTNAAAAAAELGKIAETPEEWQNVAKFWQQAIAAMESVPEGDRDYALARGKISEYQSNLETARSQPKKSPEPAKSSQPAPPPTPVQSPDRAPEKSPEPTKSSQLAPSPQPTSENAKSALQPPDFFAEGTNAAAAAAELGKIAETQQEWQNVAKFWQQAIAAMESVPEGDRNYALAREKINEYQSQLETARSQPKKSPEPASTNPPPPAPTQTDFFYEGANAAAEAAALAKTAKTPAEWQKVAGWWERAIAAMESVPKGNRDYALAREKINEYRANLEAARQQPNSRARSQPTAPPPAAREAQQPPLKQEPDFFYEGANAAAEAAELAKTAKTAADWEKVKQAWRKAIAAMKSVPEGDRDYALAREKLAEYEAALKYARSMPDDFSKGIEAATRAVELGKNAKTQSEWQTVAQNWQRAISAMKAVAPDNPQFAIASQKIIEYEYYLDSIKEKLQSAISPMTFKKSIRGNLSPKSIVYSGRGRFFVQNMMYGHTIAVYNQQYELIRTLSDTVKLSDYGYKDYPGTYRGAPVEAAFSHGGQYAWVSNYQMYGSGFGNPGDDRCSPAAQHDPSFLYRINTDTLNIENVIKVGSVPKYVAATPDNRYVLASNWCSWDLSIVDPEKNQEIRRISLGAYPRGIAIDSNSLRAYVAVMGSRDIAIINLQNFAVDWIKNVGAGPRHLNLSPDNRYLYASLNSEGTVAKIDLTNNESQKVRTGNAPRSTVLSADGQFLYVVNYFSNTVSKVRTSDLKVLQSLPTDTHPIGITYDPETQQVWVVCYSGSIMVFQD